MKKILVLAFLLAIQNISSALAFDAPIPDGGYQGRLAGTEKGKVHLLIQATTGCQGCFTAIAIDTPDLYSPTVRMVAYSGMPWDETYRKFSLTPINVDENGELTHPSDNPSLMIDLTSAPGKELTFTVTPSGSGNLLGFTSSMDFSHAKESPFDLTDPKSGEYHYFHRHKTNAVISNIQKNNQDQSLEVGMQWFGGGRYTGGNYDLKEKFPGVFSFNSLSFDAMGKTISSRTNFIAIFAKKNGEDYILMVNTIDSKDVLCLTLK